VSAIDRSTSLVASTRSGRALGTKKALQQPADELLHVIALTGEKEDRAAGAALRKKPPPLVAPAAAHSPQVWRPKVKPAKRE
jgi:hypothetical protein